MADDIASEEDHPVRRTTPAISAALITSLAIGAISGAALAQDDGPPDRIDLPAGWAPEGISALDGMLYAGSLANGAVYRAESATGEGSIFVAGQDGAVAVGLDVDPYRGALWVAGGRTGEVRAYDIETGERLSVYGVTAGFINDVAVTEAAIYVTDSFLPQLIALRLEDPAAPRPSWTSCPSLAT